MKKQFNKYPFYIILQFARLKLQEIFMPGKFLSEDNINADPIKQFNQWYHEAIRRHVPYHEAMTLSTANSHGKPSARMVLLKSFDEKGFVFFSNDDSRKGKELAENGFASLTFFWSKIGKQVRIEGVIETTAADEADNYFATRPKGSQIAAWASAQSSIIDNREVLKEKVTQLKKQYAGKQVPRPPHWVGYRLVPTHIEFWHNRANRLHDRFLFTLKENDEWQVNRLAP